MDDAELSLARAKVGAAARGIMNDLRTMIDPAVDVTGRPTALRDEAVAAAEKLLRTQVVQKLRSMPLATLRDLVVKGVRFGELERAGYSTVADIRSASPVLLLAVPGVGEKSVVEIVKAADLVARRVRQQAVIRFDLDRRSEKETVLLSRLIALKQAEQWAARLRPRVDEVTKKSAPLLVEARRCTSKARMFFAGKAARRAALTALLEVERLLVAPAVQALWHDVKAAQAAMASVPPGKEDVWRIYEHDAAAINALLAGLPGVGRIDDTEAAHGYASRDLTRRIQAVPLDTSLLKVRLRGYQVFGAQYAIAQKRSIIGDEMGLGKTVQALAAAAHLAANGQCLFLVVCPASVLINWNNEITKHTTLVPHVLYGRERDAATQAWASLAGVAVTTYTMLRRLQLPNDIRISLLVVDEAHYVKNPEAQRSLAVRSVIDRSERTLFLTGTPMENRVDEFRTLVSYLQPAVALKAGSLDALAGARAFRRAVAPVYLRRNQEDVLAELPERLEMDDWVQFTEQDERCYYAAVESRNYMKMRQAAFLASNSAKLDRLLEIVEESAANEWKVIVFSYFRNVLQSVHEAVGSAAVGPLTGSSSPAQKQKIVEDFTRHSGHAVLVSQIEAGGVGLNIQAASVVIITEPQWKPSTEEQAIARAHRMGQTRKVHVHRLMAKDSVDERMREILEHKAKLFDAYARQSVAAAADHRATDPTSHGDAIAAQDQIIEVERQRLGIDL